MMPPWRCASWWTRRLQIPNPQHHHHRLVRRGRRSLHLQARRNPWRDRWRGGRRQWLTTNWTRRNPWRPVGTAPIAASAERLTTQANHCGLGHCRQTRLSSAPRPPHRLHPWRCRVGHAAQRCAPQTGQVGQRLGSQEAHAVHPRCHHHHHHRTAPMNTRPARRYRHHLRRYHRAPRRQPRPLQTSPRPDHDDPHPTHVVVHHPQHHGHLTRRRRQQRLLPPLSPREFAPSSPSPAT